MVAVGGDEHLRLVAQAAERDRVDDAVAVALKRVARAARAAVGFRETPAARTIGVRGERFGEFHGLESFLTGCPSGLVQLKPLMRASARLATKVSLSSPDLNGPISSLVLPATSLA